LWLTESNECLIEISVYNIYLWSLIKILVYIIVENQITGNFSLKTRYFLGLYQTMAGILD